MHARMFVTFHVLLATCIHQYSTATSVLTCTCLLLQPDPVNNRVNAPVITKKVAAVFNYVIWIAIIVGSSIMLACSYMYFKRRKEHRQLFTGELMAPIADDETTLAVTDIQVCYTTIQCKMLRWNYVGGHALAALST
jgi:hypothetical protein